MTTPEISPGRFWILWPHRNQNDSRPCETRPRPGIRQLRTRVPTIPSTAGIRKTETSTLVTTTIAPAMPRPVTNGIRITSRPSSAIATVTPAKITARPEVSIARTAASSALRPWSRASR